MSDMQRTRRHDPERRQRIVDAAIEVISAHGVAAATHRRIAAEANVTLGSLTYHFAGINALLLAAFRQVADVASQKVAGRLAQASTREEAIVAVVDVITDDLWAAPRTLLLSYELYAYAARVPELTTIMRDWMGSSRAALGRHFDPLTARAIDALIEGIGIHNSVDDAPIDRDQIEAIVRRIAR